MGANLAGVEKEGEDFVQEKFECEEAKKCSSIIQLSPATKANHVKS